MGFHWTARPSYLICVSKRALGKKRSPGEFGLTMSKGENVFSIAIVSPTASTESSITKRDISCAVTANSATRIRFGSG